MSEARNAARDVTRDTSTMGRFAITARLRMGFHRRGLPKAGCMVAILFFSRIASAQNAQGTALRVTAVEVPASATEPSAQPAQRKLAAGPPKISYQEGQLRIDALGSTLAEVLSKIAALTGVNIDIPPAANTERMPAVELGPGPARQILAALLSDSNFDYLIQASDTDPEKIQSILVMTREKKTGGVNVEASARPPRSANSRAVAPPPPPEEAPAAETPVVVLPDNAAPEATSMPQPPPPAPVQPDPSTTLPSMPLDQTQFPLLQQDPANPTRPGALTPPASLNPQTMNQQLQQMYQQRMQMLQQTQSVPPGVRQ